MGGFRLAYKIMDSIMPSLYMHSIILCSHLFPLPMFSLLPKLAPFLPQIITRCSLLLSVHPRKPAQGEVISLLAANAQATRTS